MSDNSYEWFGLPPGEPIEGKTYRADGWVYRDVDWMTSEFFDTLNQIIGEENIVWLAVSTCDGDKRGQCLVSPDGMKNLTAYAEQHRQKQ